MPASSSSNKRASTQAGREEVGDEQAEPRPAGRQGALATGTGDDQQRHSRQGLLREGCGDTRARAAPMPLGTGRTRTAASRQRRT
jgi:hypothetical protein